MFWWGWWRLRAGEDGRGRGEGVSVELARRRLQAIGVDGMMVHMLATRMLQRENEIQGRPAIARDGRSSWLRTARRRRLRRCPLHVLCAELIEEPAFLLDLLIVALVHHRAGCQHRVRVCRARGRRGQVHRAEVGVERLRREELAHDLILLRERRLLAVDFGVEVAELGDLCFEALHVLCFAVTMASGRERMSAAASGTFDGIGMEVHDVLLCLIDLLSSLLRLRLLAAPSSTGIAF